MRILSSLQNSDQNRYLVYRLPEEDFNVKSVLTVNPGEEAIFVKEGNIVQVFGNGRYELNTNNYPFLSAIRNILSNGDSTFHCSVYFVSINQSTELLWGMSFPLRDPVQQIFTKILVRGGYRVRIINGSKFLLKLLGYGIKYVSVDYLKSYFGNQFKQTIITLISQEIMGIGEEILAMCTKLSTLSEKVYPHLSEVLSDYGLKLETFSISGMEIDEKDPNRFLLEQAYAKRREKDIMKDDYDKIKDKDIMTNISKNEGLGGAAGIGAAIGMGARFMSEFGTISSNSPQEHKGSDEYIERLERLQLLKERNYIDQEEYETLKKVIIKEYIGLC